MTRKRFLRYWQLYLLLILPMLYLLIFRSIPMIGVQIAFREFNAVDGMWGSPWVGITHFTTFFSSPRFLTIVANTAQISVLSMVFGFPAPIVLALFLNEIRNGIFKLSVQLVTAIPHFISTVVMAGLVLLFLEPKGFIGRQMHIFGIQDSVSIMGVADLFKYIYALSDMWQHMGYNSIIYLAALSGINPELYEAAKVDGANLIKKIIHIDLPGIMPVIIILFILNTGQILQVGFEKTYLLQNNLNLPGSEVLQTFVYKIGLLNANYSYSTAVDVFNSVVSFAFLVMVNFIVRKYSENSLW